MQVPNSTNTFTGLLKEIYGERLIPLAKKEGIILDRLGLDIKDMVGNKFHQPVDLQLEHGFSCGPANSTINLIGAISGQSQDAQVDGSQIVGQASINYELIYKSLSAGKKAFMNATEALVKRLAASAVFRREFQVMHGQEGAGIVASFTSPTTTTKTITITDAEWSSGIWSSMIGAQIDVYAANLSTQRNTGVVTINSINSATKTLNVTTAVTSDMAALAATDVIFFRTHSVLTEAAGLGKILSNTSGTLFNISAASYDLWGGNVVTGVGAFSLDKVLNAVAKTADYGAKGKMTAVCSTAQFERLNSDQSALRKYDASYRAIKGENGTESLLFHSQVGPLEILPHPLQKAGKCYIFMESEAKRIGSTDITFVKRAGSSDALVMESGTQGASEMRVFSQEALFIEQPKHTVVMTGIV